MNFRADLHCHSTCSDGSLTPQELIALAKQEGLQGLSITDHDTIEAYPAAFQFAKEQNIELIPGIEFSTQLDSISVHILAYSFDISHPAIHELIAKHKKRRHDRNLQMIDKLKKEGFDISFEELEKTAKGTVGRPHIAKLLVDKGYLADYQTAFHTYIGDGKRCYVAGVPLTIPETLDVIHAAHGFAVLAHPHLYKSKDFVLKILTAPFDGIECYYAEMPASQNGSWVKLAKEKNLMVTGGSDFHGAMKPLIKLGCSTVDETLFAPLLKHYHELL